jgi:hypothetical protein
MIRGALPLLVMVRTCVVPVSGAELAYMGLGLRVTAGPFAAAAAVPDALIENAISPVAGGMA